MSKLSLWLPPRRFCSRTSYKRKLISPDILRSVVKIWALHELDGLVQLSNLLLLLCNSLLELVRLVQELRLLLGQLHQVVGVAGQLRAPGSALQLHRKKRFTSFPSPAGMSLTKLPLGRNNSVMTSLLPPRESLVVTSLLETVNSPTFFYGV